MINGWGQCYLCTKQPFENGSLRGLKMSDYLKDNAIARNFLILLILAMNVKLNKLANVSSLNVCHFTH